MNHCNIFAKVALTFLWVGFVGAISFMEAWLKFTAPGVTLNVGLSIGQVVFEALNKIELAIGTLIVLVIISDREKKIQDLIFFACALATLITQTFWLLPLLSSRIDLILSGHSPGRSNGHLIYMIMEIVKIVTLIIYGLKQMNYGKYKTAHTWSNSNA